MAITTAGPSPMKHVNVALTIEELRLLVSLASDQLFRRQFIDPRMPGYKGNPEEVSRGKALIGRMQGIIDEGGKHAGSSSAQAPPSKERESTRKASMSAT